MPSDPGDACVGIRVGRKRLLVVLFLLLATPCSIAGVERPIVAVDISESAAGIEESLRESGWLRWLMSREEGPELVIGSGVDGDTRLLVRTLPLAEEVSALVEDLPVRLDEGHLELDGVAYEEPTLSMALRLSPENSTWLITGYRNEQIAQLLNLVLLKEVGVKIWGRDDTDFDYLLRETPWLERSGRWKAGSEGFEIDRQRERDDFAARDLHYAKMKKIPGRSAEIAAPADLSEQPGFAELARRLDKATGEMAGRIPVVLESPIAVVVEPDHVVQGRYQGQIGEAVLTDEGSVHLVVHRDDEHAYRHRIAGALLTRSGLGEELSLWLREGAALWLSQQWYGIDWKQWLPKLSAARVLPTVEQLIAEERQEDASAPLWVPVAASVIDAAPGKTLREKLGSLPDEKAIEAHLANLARLELPSEDASVPPAVPFLRGVSLAMLNRIDGGYHAPAVERQLDRLRGLGADAISVMPFAYQPAPDSPELRFLNSHPTSETDIGVMFTTRRARAEGFNVLWKPHIWLSHGSWPGDVEMGNDSDWAAWWESYRRYIAHHAFLAEWTGSELFSIGVELGKTLGRQKDWEELIASVRVLYSGVVTYSGNWHSDYDIAPFWEDLDFVGVDAYFPLANEGDAGLEELQEGAARVAERLKTAAERFGKPVILTEFGFAARHGAWVEPHKEGGEYSAEHQALAYRTLLEGLGKPSWLKGVFAWKVFTADRGGDAGTSSDFRFLGRPAEAAVRDYFAPRESAGR